MEIKSNSTDFLRVLTLVGGSLPAARSQARHRYQLATERQGCHFFARRSMSAGVARSAGVTLVVGLRLAEGEGEAFADAVVAGGEDVGAAEAEDEQHLDGPVGRCRGPG